MNIEALLEGWTGPSSATEADKQDRAIRMVRDAVSAHSGFEGANIQTNLKGSYPNNTNVKSDSDVDIYVECRDVAYWKNHTPGARGANPAPYSGIWTPQKLRSELVSALKNKFGGDVDDSGTLAVRIDSNTARVDADVVPAFTYNYFFSATSYEVGTKSFRTSGESVVNYPAQQLVNGRAKNTRTSTYFKKGVRILKRLENELVAKGLCDELPSYFIECLAYNCPDEQYMLTSWSATVRALIVHIWAQLEGEEPSEEEKRWLEVNGRKFLFSAAQPWSREKARAFALAGWKFLEFKS